MFAADLQQSIRRGVGDMKKTKKGRGFWSVIADAVGWDAAGWE
jgi:hypothetical protein